MKRKSSHKLRLFDHLWPWGIFKRSGSLQFQVLRRALTPKVRIFSKKNINSRLGVICKNAYIFAKSNVNFWYHFHTSE
ncbi:hypothetical protein BV917_17225 [Leptospira santarosai serovar Guaricura]|nr:hypothetical protein BV917_17225 [Leptospira santarosai serovar Guaricura]